MADIEPENFTDPELEDDVENPRKQPLGPRYPITYLSSLITSTFSGDHNTLSDFLSDCNNAFELCHPDQQHALLLTVLAKIKSPDKSTLNPYTFRSWDELKIKL